MPYRHHLWRRRLQLTCPEPSRRKYLPTALLATAALPRCTNSLTPMLYNRTVVETFDASNNNKALLGCAKSRKDQEESQRRGQIEFLLVKVAWPGAGIRTLKRTKAFQKPIAPDYRPFPSPPCSGLVARHNAHFAIGCDKERRRPAVTWRS